MNPAAPRAERPADSAERTTGIESLPTWLLHQAELRAARIVADQLTRADARMHHVRLLDALDVSGPLPQTALGSAARLDRADVTVTLAELESAALVERTADPDDGRRKLVALTSAGADRLAGLRAVLDRAQDDAFAALDADERSQLVDLLARLQP